MPSIRYINQSAPFWDFIANMEEQGSQHPFFSGGASRGADAPPAWSWGGPQNWHRGPPPPHYHRGDAGEGPSNQAPPPPPEGSHASPPPGPDGHPAPPPPPGAEHDGPFAHRPHPHPHGRRGGCHGRRGRGGPAGGPWGAHGFGGFPLGGLEAFLNSQIFGNNGQDSTNNNEEPKTQTSPEDFSPPADVFDTETSFIIHVSLPGAKKEDVGVNWDAEKSEISIAGVVYRPGDEDFLKTLALDERQVGAFEKKIRLGTRANAAQVDADMITAKLEDGVLRVDVPKLDRDYVEVKKVDIE